MYESQDVQQRATPLRWVELTPSEIGQLISTVTDAHVRVVIRTQVFTGIRTSEVLRLQTQDVDLEHKCIHVRTPGRFRDVPLIPFVARELELYCQTELASAGNTEPCFITDQGHPLTLPYYNVHLSRAA